MDDNIPKIYAISVRPAVVEELQRVALEHDKPITSFPDETLLLESGLDSLCLAIVVARLEDLFGVDPFSTIEEISFPTTVGDFIGLYERAVQ